VKLVNKLWARIERTLEGLALPYQRIRLYQDGLAMGGRKRESVTELAKAGSCDNGSLHGLREKMATIMGTESSELLAEEYEFVKGHCASGEVEFAPGEEPRRKAFRDSLLSGETEN
jgi:hypothetical protein